MLTLPAARAFWPIQSDVGVGDVCDRVIAALTAQNTRAVTGVMPVPAAFVKEQIDTLFADVRIDAVKIGMLGAQDVMAAVAQALRAHQASKGCA